MEILNVTGSVLQYLRDKIITGELKSGQKLNENALSSSLSISRPPLREVFRMLEKDHMVINIPRKGTYVAELSVKDYEELSQIREMMECYAIDLLKTSNIRDLPKVTLALNKALSLPMFNNSVDPEELLNRIRVILNFHSSLVESAGNSRLVYNYHSVSLNLARYQFIYFYVSGSAQHSLDDHSKILEFIRNGNYDQAKEELRKHIHYTMELVRDRILYPAVSDAESVPF
jgi:DNA-binding GntR family transcriptional regulator